MKGRHKDASAASLDRKEKNPTHHPVSHVFRAKTLVAPLKGDLIVSKGGFRFKAKILDAGCGTGLVGEILHEKKYKNIVGIDFSQPMLQRPGSRR